VYALSGVGLVVLYRATGVLNVAFGAIGAAGALIAYYLIHHTSWPRLARVHVCVLSGGSSTLPTAWSSAPPSRGATRS
jgi:branched-chain amino acid transport system permease protein